MIGSDLTIEEVAARLGLPVEMIRRRVEAGDLPVHWVEVDGRLEVRVPDAATAPAPPVGNDRGRAEAAPPAAGSARPAPAPPAGPQAEPPAAVTPIALAADEEAVPEREWQGLVQPGQSSLALTQVDARQLVAGLFDRWERAL
ncbi:MAG TPA: hypothetical protein VMW49_07710, partial [Candidatus Dormibacteraeota bacterium]|nr:hypothetical protein [Candidatus Dormibacteraeota bacterium]